MSCPDPERLEPFARGDLDQGAEAELAEHVAACADCRGLVDEIRANDSFAGEWGRALASLGQSPSPGPALPGYTLVRELHRGGQGIVYEAVQESTKRRVAVKLLHLGAFATTRQMRRFEREVDLAASLAHPGIATVFDSGRAAGGAMFLAMELVDGQPLDRYLAAHAPPLARRLRLFVSICAAVHHAHQRGILHRDLKPGNILVDAAGEPRVVDFGLAKTLAVAEAGSSLDTLPGEFVGTLAYAAPEQLEQDATAVDVRSDVYALGVILYQALTGRLPHAVTGSLGAVVLRILNDEPEPPSAHGRELDRDLDSIALKALEKDPRERYQSVSELAADVLNHLRGDPVLARSDSGLYVLRRRLRRHRKVVAGAALVFTSLLAAAILSTVFWLQSVEDRDRAIRERNHLREVRDFQSRMIASANPYADGHTVTVLDLLDSAARTLGGEYRDQPELRADLEATIADSYSGLRLPERAAEHYGESWRLFREQRGEHDPATLDARLGYVEARAPASPPEETAAELAGLVRLCREHLGPAHDTTLDALTALARLDEDRGALEDAERAYREVVERSSAAPPDRGGATASAAESRQESRLVALNNLAGCLLSQGRPEEAEGILRDVFESYEALRGFDFPATLTTANVLGQTWTTLGRLDEAEPLLRRTLEARRRVFGATSWVTCNSLNALGLCLLSAGELEEARDVLAEAVAVGRQVLPPRHLELLRVMRSLGGALWQSGELGQARAVLDEAHRLLVEHHGADHPDALATGLGVGCVALAAGEPETAASVFRELLAVASSPQAGAVAGDVVFCAEVRLYLGVCLARLGETAEAERVYRRGYRDLLDELGPDHAKTVAARAGLEGIVGKVPAQGD